MPQRYLSSSSMPLPSEVNSSASMLHCCTSTWSGVYHSNPVTWQTCCILDSAVWGGYPPQGPLECPAHDSAWSGPGVWYESSPPQASPHRASYGVFCTCEGYPVVPGIIQGGGGCVAQVAPGHPVLSLTMRGQVSRCQVRVALSSVEFLVELLPAGVSLTYHPETIGIHIVTPKHAKRLKIHARHLGHIGAEAHRVEYLRQCVKVPLKSCRPGQHKDAIVIIYVCF